MTCGKPPLLACQLGRPPLPQPLLAPPREVLPLAKAALTAPNQVTALLHMTTGIMHIPASVRINIQLQMSTVCLVANQGHDPLRGALLKCELKVSCALALLSPLQSQP